MYKVKNIRDLDLYLIIIFKFIDLENILISIL